MRYRPIRRNGEFGRVYARGKSYVNQALVLYVLKTRSKRTRVGPVSYTHLTLPTNSRV